MNTCRHWIGSDATGRMCREPAAGPLPYCEKHIEIERARALKTIQKHQAQSDRTEAEWRARNIPRLPQMRVQLERAEAEYARRTASPIGDRAAVGGSMHGSIVRAQRGHLSDSNVARVVELEPIIKSLQADIARAERSA